MNIVKIAVALPAPAFPPNPLFLRDSLKIHVSSKDASTDAALQNPFNKTAERKLHWYLAQYAAAERFEIRRAKSIEGKLREYGRKVVTALTSSGLFPQTVDLLLEIEVSPSERQANVELRGTHWEILADQPNGHQATFSDPWISREFRQREYPQASKQTRSHRRATSSL